VVLSTVPTPTPEDAIGGAGRVAPPRADTLDLTTETFRVVTWEDPVVERLGFSPLSRYVELFWLPILGPSACLLLRRVADLLIAHPEGLELSTDDTARSLGLGGSSGRHAPFPRAVGRCVRYGMARRPAPGTVAFRRMVGPLPLRLVRRLPPPLLTLHEHWERTDLDDRAQQLHRARVIAFEVAGVAADPNAVAQHLRGLGVHPALVDELARWVAPVVPVAQSNRPVSGRSAAQSSP
jgi:hypothetical protein